MYSQTRALISQGPIEGYIAWAFTDFTRGRERPQVPRGGCYEQTALSDTNRFAKGTLPPTTER